VLNAGEKLLIQRAALLRVVIVTIIPSINTGSKPKSIMPQPYQAVLIVSFGGPEGMDDVVPFLENVLRGKNVPRERMLEVAEHYRQFGGKSPLNDQNRQLIAALERELAAAGLKLPVYWGNRNWHPLLADTLRQMAADGIRRALAFVTSAYSSYSSCRQYLEDIVRAQAEVGADAPQVDKLRAFYNHPGFIEPMLQRAWEGLSQIPQERRASAHLVFTAHSIPVAMAAGCRYEEQLREASSLVVEGLKFRGLGDYAWRLVYQSRSGPPSQAWLEPDVCEHLRQLHAAGTVRDVVVVPIGFLSDHIEVLFDLDVQARQLCQERGMNMVRAATVGTHPAFVNMVRELIEERLGTISQRRALGKLGPSHDVCPENCCPSGRTA
jgi:ferrochelatase